jgi:predicted RNA-binding protein Jag
MKEIFGIFGRKKAPVESNNNMPLTEAAAPLAPMDGAPVSEIAQLGIKQLESIVQQMGFQPKVKAREEEGVIYLDMQGDDLGRLIGKEGNTLNALQCLIGGMLSKKNAQRVMVKVDANNYRVRREQTLKRIAQEAAQMAAHQQRPVELDPMPANERRVIHAELSGRKDVHTYSKGDRYQRRLIVAPGPAPEGLKEPAGTDEPQEELQEQQ